MEKQKAVTITDYNVRKVWFSKWYKKRSLEGDRGRVEFLISADSVGLVTRDII